MKYDEDYYTLGADSDGFNDDQDKGEGLQPLTPSDRSVYKLGYERTKPLHLNFLLSINETITYNANRVSRIAKEVQLPVEAAI